MRTRQRVITRPTAECRKSFAYESHSAVAQFVNVAYDRADVRRAGRRWEDEVRAPQFPASTAVPRRRPCVNLISRSTTDGSRGRHDVGEPSPSLFPSHLQSQQPPPRAVFDSTRPVVTEKGHERCPCGRRSRSGRCYGDAGSAGSTSSSEPRSSPSSTSWSGSAGPCRSILLPAELRLSSQQTYPTSLTTRRGRCSACSSPLASPPCSLSSTARRRLAFGAPRKCSFRSSTCCSRFRSWSFSPLP